ncbi:predicted protein [Streptomyces viridosporus ATCC 14672]|uniref:Predicted protein n=1 Tax=Streptomyces viridosporus (strain ATCC 14672 / DSM 40746 / JCM 4963 / KCTC 9882 / NRRL B-12104 / FH 1290) TaxID=566461 RepID=D6A5U6_STRV1|nr:predicted protein [Streptomyces viridosporus ATCC 14672]
MLRVTHLDSDSVDGAFDALSAFLTAVAALGPACTRARAKAPSPPARPSVRPQGDGMTMVPATYERGFARAALYADVRSMSVPSRSSAVSAGPFQARRPPPPGAAR